MWCWFILFFFICILKFIRVVVGWMEYGILLGVCWWRMGERKFKVFEGILVFYRIWVKCIVKKEREKYY